MRTVVINYWGKLGDSCTISDTVVMETELATTSDHLLRRWLRYMDGGLRRCSRPRGVAWGIKANIRAKSCLIGAFSPCT